MISLKFHQRRVLIRPLLYQQLTNPNLKHLSNPKQHLHPRLRTIRTPLRDRSRINVQLLSQPFVADALLVKYFPDAVEFLHAVMTASIARLPRR